jgi:hypothetical protein
MSETDGGGSSVPYHIRTRIRVIRVALPMVDRERS